MSTMRGYGNRLAALLLGAGLLGGGAMAADVGAAAPASQATPAAAAQATPPAAQTAAADCEEDEGNGREGERDADNVEAENGADDAAEGDTDADTAADEAAENDGENGEEGEEDEAATAARPGELSEGRDLLPRAAIGVERAVAAAQGRATGELGSVELEEKDGWLVFEVTVGEQEVFVDAADGAIVSVGPVQNGEHNGGDGCEDGEATDGTPGALDDGQNLLSRATITVAQAVRAV